MAHDGDSFYSKQRCTAVFRVIETASESVECVLCEDVSNLGGERLLKFLAEHRPECFDKTFAEFQADVAGETIAHDDIDFAFEDVAAFDVPNKIDWRTLQILERFLGQLVSFRVLFADGQQSDARTANAEDRVR